MASTEFQNRVNALQDNDSNGINNELKQFFESAANRKLMRASSEKSAVSREHAITVAKEMQILDDAKKTALKNAIATLMNTLTATIDGQTKTCAEILAKDRTRASKQNIAELKQAAALVSLHYMIEKGKPLFYGKDAQDYAWQFCDNKPETTDTQTEPVKTEGKTVTPPSNTDTEKEPTQTPTAPEKTKEVVEAEKKVEEKNKALEKAKETAEKAKTDEEKKAAAEIVKKEKAALEEAEKAANTIKEKEATNTTPKEVVVDALPSSDVQKSVEDAMRLKNIEEFTKNTLTNLIPPTDGTFKFEKKELEKMKAGSQNIQKRLNEITDYNKLASSMNQIMQQIHDNASKGLIPSDVSIDPQSDSVKVVFDHSLSNKNNERPAWEEHIDRQYKAFTDRKKELDKPTYQQFINIAENLPTFEGLAPALTAYKEAQTAVRETEKTIAQKEEEAYRLIKENAEQRAILATVPETSTKDSDIAQRKQATEKLTENYIKLYGNRVVDQNLPGLGKTS